MARERWSLGLFGRPRLLHGAQEIHIPRRKATGLLAYLAMSGGMMPRERICSLLWPDQSEHAARSALRTTLTALRDVLPEGAMQSTRDTVALVDGHLDSVDAVEFEDGAAKVLSRTHGADGSLEADEIPLVDGLLARVSGTFLEGFALRDCPEFDDWQFMTAERLRGRQMDLLWLITHALVDDDRHDEALAHARVLLSLEPTDESVQQELMILLSERGDRHGALTQYEAFDRIARREDDEEARRSLEDLARAIRATGRTGGPTTKADGVPEDAPSSGPARAAPHAELSARRDNSSGIPSRRIVSLAAIAIHRAGTRSEPEGTASDLGRMARAAGALHDGIVMQDGIVGREGLAGVVIGFGLSSTHDDDPRRALRAAQGVLEYLKTEGRTGSGVIITEIVDTAGLGEWVERIVRRLEALPPGTLAVCANTRTALEPRWRMRLLDLPNEDASLSLFRVEGVAHNGYGASEPPFVGRRREMHDLMRVCVEAEHAPGWVAFVSGEAGIGKSRLVAETRTLCEEDPPGEVPARWYLCPAMEHLRTSFLAPFREMVSRMIAELAGSERADEAALQTCMEFLVTWDELLPADIVPATMAVHRLLHASSHASQPRHASSTEANALLRDARQVVGGLVRRVCAQHPMIIVLEDLHWADAGSAALLVDLAQSSQHLPLSLIITYRPGDLRDLRTVPESIAAHTMGRHLHLALDHLSPREAREIYDTLLADIRSETPPQTQLLDQAGGNPLYVVELCRLLRHHGNDGLLVPQSLVRIVQRRIDSLSDDAQQVLRAAAVIGGRFSLRMLSAVAADVFRVPDVRAAVGTLVAEDVLRVVSPDPMMELEFSHSLVREALYEKIPRSLLGGAHAGVVTAAEQLLEAGEHPDMEFMAHHAQRAGNAERAGHYLRVAGDEARANFDTLRAIECYRRAEAHQPDDVRLLLAYAQVLHDRMRFAESADAYARAFRVLNATPPPGMPPDGSGGTLRIGQPPFPLAIDPMRDSTPPCVFFQRGLFRGLARFRADGALVPDAAASWEIAPDGRTYRFVVRDDAFWSDGVPITAEDFRAGIVRGLLANESGVQGLQLPLTGTDEYLESGDERALGVHASGEKTLEVTLVHPCSHLLMLLADLWRVAIPLHVIARHGGRWSEPEHCVYSGRFVVATLENESAVLTRNPHYRSGGPLDGNVDEVRFAAADDDELFMKFAGAELDVVPVPRPRARRALREFREYLRSGPTGRQGVVIPNTNRDHMRHLNVRQALAHAIDRRDLVRRVFGGAHHPALGGLIPPSVIGHSSDIGLGHDPERAARLLTADDRERFANDPLVILAPDTLEELARIVTQKWKEVLDIRCRLRVLPFVDFLEAVMTPDYDVIIGSTAAFLFPEASLHGILYSRLRQVPIPILATMQELEWVRESGDITERLDRVRELDRRFTWNALRIPLFYQNAFTLIQPWVHGFRADPFVYANFEDLHLSEH